MSQDRRLAIKVSFIAVIAYFLIKVVYLAIMVKPGIPPDEQFHFAVSQFYFAAKGALLEADSLYIAQGPISRNGFLYHYTLGLLLHLRPAFVDNNLFLRLMNVVCASLYLLFFIKMARLITQSTMLTLAALIIQTNLLMFTFLSSAISYDNFINLLSLMVVYTFLAHLKEPRDENIYLFVLICALGSLTKISFLPLVALLVPLLILFDVYQYRKNSQSMRYDRRLIGLVEPLWGRHTPLKRRILGLLIVLSVGIAGKLYITNIVEFGRIQPTCEQVYSDALCYANNSIVKRDKDMISHAPNATELMPLMRYIPKWSHAIASGMLGIHAHQNFFPSDVDANVFLNLTKLCLILAALQCAIAVKQRKLQKMALPLTALLIGCFYLAFLLYFVNFSAYKNTGIFNLALQGRYTFPVIGAMICSLTFFGLNKLPRVIQLVCVLILACYFIYFEFPYFFLHVNRSTFF